ncbi:MAG: hypothetical protein K1Y36_21835 [Blastocatellia bacterium]|nr:hypothetical protein [Blastocatellia bacterium]
MNKRQQQAFEAGLKKLDRTPEQLSKELEDAKRMVQRFVAGSPSVEPASALPAINPLVVSTGIQDDSALQTPPGGAPLPDLPRPENTEKALSSDLSESSTLRRLNEPLDVQTSKGSTKPDVWTSGHSNPQTSKGSTARHPGVQPSIDHEKSYRERNLIRHTLRLPEPVSKQVKDFCHLHNLEFQDFFLRLATYFFQLPKDQTSATLNLTLDVQTSHDDMMIFTTMEDIIMRYQRFTLRTWTRRDDRVGRQFNGTNPLILDIAFITTIEKKLRGNTATEPVKSFNYFVAEIQSLIAAETEHRLPIALGEYHRYCLHKWDTEILPLRNKKWRIG